LNPLPARNRAISTLSGLSTSNLSWCHIQFCSFLIDSAPELILSPGQSCTILLKTWQQSWRLFQLCFLGAELCGTTTPLLAAPLFEQRSAACCHSKPVLTQGHLLPSEEEAGNSSRAAWRKHTSPGPSVQWPEGQHPDHARGTTQLSAGDKSTDYCFKL